MRRAASRAARCWLAVRRRRRSWTRLRAERKRWAWRADLDRCICRSRRRAGWCDTSARSFKGRLCRCSTPGRNSRFAAAQLVSDHHPWRILRILQQLAEEPLGRFGLAPALDQDVEHMAVLVHRAPKGVHLAADAEERLAEMPLAARFQPAPLDRRLRPPPAAWQRESGRTGLRTAGPAARLLPRYVRRCAGVKRQEPLAAMTGAGRTRRQRPQRQSQPVPRGASLRQFPVATPRDRRSPDRLAKAASAGFSPGTPGTVRQGRAGATLGD